MVEIMNIINEYREVLDEILDLEFVSPKGNKIILGDEIEKMMDNKKEYRKGAIPVNWRAYYKTWLYLCNYTANGSTNQFDITFSYIEQSHIKVYVNNVEDVFTFVNSSLNTNVFYSYKWTSCKDRKKHSHKCKAWRFF